MSPENQLDDESFESPLLAGDPNERYSRQIRFASIGKEGQQRISRSSALILGCGALGSAISNLLARGGVGRLVIVDRDIVEISNLQRQSLFDERDAALGIPKAIAAAEKLRLINSTIEIEPVVADVSPANIEKLISGVDIILDGTDNFETRFLINDAAVKHNKPWVYGGCLGADGQTMTILPGVGPCLSCLMPEGPPTAGTSPTCDTYGILATIIHVIASIQANEAIKILSGNSEVVRKQLTVVSLWESQFRSLNLDRLRDQVDCPTCKQNRYDWLEGNRWSQSTILCGRNSVQLSSTGDAPISLSTIGERLSVDRLGEVQWNEYRLRLKIDQYTLTLFSDGRAIVQGTEEPAVARKIYAQYIGA